MLRARVKSLELSVKIWRFVPIEKDRITIPFLTLNSYILTLVRSGQAVVLPGLGCGNVARLCTRLADEFFVLRRGRKFCSHFVLGFAQLFPQFFSHLVSVFDTFVLSFHKPNNNNNKLCIRT
jgi:hypothetical protein